MPWSDQSGGGWKSGGGGPWGPRPTPGQQPDLEEILRRSQDRLRQAMPGGRMGGPLATLLAVIAIALIGFFGFTVRVNPDELGIVLRFGKYVRQLPPGLNFRWPYPIEQVELPKVTRVNRIEIGMRGSSELRSETTTIRDVPEDERLETRYRLVARSTVLFFGPAAALDMADPDRILARLSRRRAVPRAPVHKQIGIE